jgi:hypothetical protein
LAIGHFIPNTCENTGFDGPTLTVFGSNYGTGTHEFWLTAFALNGCSDTDTINVTFYNDSGIEDVADQENLAIYPNPTVILL